jgi:hypothetical protein
MICTFSVRNRFLLVPVLMACFASLTPTHAAAPAVPTLTAPANNATGQTTSPVLSWTSTAGTGGSYSLQISSFPNFSDTLFSKTSISGITYSLYGLFNGAKYHWRVKAVNRSGQASAWSTVWNFTTRMATAINGNHIGPTDVGIWYIPYGYIGGNWGVPFNPLCSDAQGDFRQYDMSDTTIFDYHLKKIADAKIDFLIFDNTNGGFSPGYNDTPQTRGYVATSGLMCRQIKSWNDSYLWKIRYLQAIGCGAWLYKSYGNFNDCVEKQAQQCYTNFLQNALYGGANNWYYLDGKPLLILFAGGDTLSKVIKKWYSFVGSSNFATSSTNLFTVRFADWGERGTYGWPVWSGDGNGHHGTIIDNEVELVSPGYNGGPNINIIPRDNGQFYSKSCWDIVLENKSPTIVVITSFNDYWEQTAVWTAKSNSSCAKPFCEPWIGLDGVEHPDMYWNLTKTYITRLRGLLPIMKLLLGNK